MKPKAKFAMAGAFAAAMALVTPTAWAETATTPLRAVVVAGGKPPGVVEGQRWSTYAMLRDASGQRIGDASIACVVAKARDKRVIAECGHTLRFTGKGTLLVNGVHHYKDQTVMPGTAEPMRLILTGGTGEYAGSSGQVDVLEERGGYTYQLGPTG